MKTGKLGFSKRELSKINVETVIEKCIEFDFEESQYHGWISNVETYDTWISQHVPQKKVNISKTKHHSSSDEESGK